MENKILHGDSLDLLKDMDDNSVDSVVTDPPYGYSFMGKDWDKALPPIEIWKECVRVLKPGGFAFVMSAPRSDVHSRMCLMLEEAGFRIDFTPIAWTYATGFPKAMNIGKMVDKRLGTEKIIGKGKAGKTALGQSSEWNKTNNPHEFNITEPNSSQAKDLDGSYGGFQPKPAWENVIVCMKPLSEKGYLDQALKNGKGITWLGDCRVPFQGQSDIDSGGWWGITKEEQSNALREHHEYYKGYDDGSYVGYTKKGKKKMTDKERYASGTSRYDNGEPETGFGTTEHIYGDNTTKYSKKKKSDYEKYVEKQKSFKGAKTIGEVNEGGNTFLGGDMKQLDPSETYLKKTTKRKPRPDDSTWAESGFKSEDNDTAEASPMGRFPANLLVQDDVLNNGKFSKSAGGTGVAKLTNYGKYNEDNNYFNYQDEGSFSRYYDLDAWWTERIQELPLNVQATYPFIIVPKASKAEKNKGCEGMEEKESKQVYSDGFNSVTKLDPKQHTKESVANRKGNQNNHPTVKPISLMSYLITLGSREDDLVLDPFVGSGTTCIAAKLLNRKYIGMEMDSDYVVIAQERIKAHEPEKQQHDFF